MPCHALASQSPREPYYIQIYSPLLYMLVFLCAGFLVRLIITYLLLTFILLSPLAPAIIILLALLFVTIVYAIVICSSLLYKPNHPPWSLHSFVLACHALILHLCPECAIIGSVGCY